MLSAETETGGEATTIGDHFPQYSVPSTQYSVLSAERTEALENRQIAAVFRMYADLLELAGEERFRIAAYRRASDTIRHAETPITDLFARHQLQSLPGIGPRIAEEIEELLTTGRVTGFDALRAAVPPVVVALTRVPGIGPKTALQLHQRLNLPDLAAYEQAVAGGALRSIKGIGVRREAEILSGLRARVANEGRILLGLGVAIATEVIAELTARLPGIEIVPIGSLRRWSPTLGDIDLLAATDGPDAALDAFTTLPNIVEIVRRDADSARVRLSEGVEAEILTRPRAHIGGALLWLTGNKPSGTDAGFRDTLSTYAADRGFTLDSSGLRRGDAFVEGDEHAAFAALGLPFIPPELREGSATLDTIQATGVPRLVALEDIRGDLHTHTTWSDGSGTIAAMAERARQLGYSYYGVSDHSYSLRIANGLDAERLRQQAGEIAATDAGIRILRSCEVEVHSDGQLDLDDATLAALDYAIASVHSGQRGDRAVVTARTIRAITNPYVDIIAHPTGRMVLRREPMDLDLDAVIAAAAQTNTALEINGDSHRLDFDATIARQAAAAGVIITVNSDAHGPDGLGNMLFGVMTARRAWLAPEQVLNCWPAEEILARRTKRRKC